MKLITLGFIFVIIGVILITVGMLKMVASRTGESEVRGGGVIMIGPIPIIFGTDVGALKAVMILAILLMVLATILLFVVPPRM